MAEIKSTMEMVMERAARIGKASSDELGSEDITRQGMKEAARYLREEGVDLAELMEKAPTENQVGLRNGMVRTLLRNVTLPREEQQQELGAKALQGLLQISRGDGELAGMFGDMQSILARYLDHRKQLRQQLEEQFAQQMQMMEKNLAQQTGMAMKLQPSQHPKFQEEWQRLQAELNGQYGKAIEQYKAVIEQRLVL